MEDEWNLALQDAANTSDLECLEKVLVERRGVTISPATFDAVLEAASELGDERYLARVLYHPKFTMLSAAEVIVRMLEISYFVYDTAHDYVQRTGQLETLHKKLWERHQASGLEDDQVLSIAARYGWEDLVQACLADPRYDPNENDNDALVNAVDYHQGNVVRLLLADPRVDRSEISFYHVHFNEAFDVAWVQCLVEWGVCPHAKTIQQAVDRRHREVVRLLLQVASEGQRNAVYFYSPRFDGDAFVLDWFQFLNDLDAAPRIEELRTVIEAILENPKNAQALTAFSLMTTVSSIIALPDEVICDDDFDLASEYLYEYEQSLHEPLKKYWEQSKASSVLKEYQLIPNIIDYLPLYIERY